MHTCVSLTSTGGVRLGVPRTSSGWRCFCLPVRCHSTSAALEGAVWDGGSSRCLVMFLVGYFLVLSLLIYFPPVDQKDVASSSSVLLLDLLFHLHAKSFDLLVPNKSKVSSPQLLEVSWKICSDSPTRPDPQEYCPTNAASGRRIRNSHVSPN